MIWLYFKFPFYKKILANVQTVVLHLILLSNFWQWVKFSQFSGIFNSNISWVRTYWSEKLVLTDVN